MEILADPTVPSTTTPCPIHSESAKTDSEWVGQQSASSSHRLAIAIDLGTTTIAAQLIDAASGDVLGVETMLNPQSAFGSDVMSRIRAALDGQRPHHAHPRRARPARRAPHPAAAHRKSTKSCSSATPSCTICSAASTSSRSRTCPSQSPHLAEQRFTASDLGWDLPSDCVIRFARCIGGFVGSDILAGIVAAGIALGDDLSALVDLGTNGEIAIGNRHGIVCASTAAGPAFEAGAIRMGMRAVTGAIAYVSLDEWHAPRHRHRRRRAARHLRQRPRRRCRRGPALRSHPRQRPHRRRLKDLPRRAARRPLSIRHSRAATCQRRHRRRLPPPPQAPRRMPQLDLRAIHLAGAFGNYVQIESALRIGLLEAPHALIHAAGNTALRGAKMLLLADRTRAPAHRAREPRRRPRFSGRVRQLHDLPRMQVAPVSRPAVVWASRPAPPERHENGCPTFADSRVSRIG